MTEITGTPEQVLERVQAIVEGHVSGVVCELQKYKTEIGCGALNAKGYLDEVKMSARSLTEYVVESHARALASRAEPRGLLIRRA